MTTLGDVSLGRDGIQTGPFGSQLHAHEYSATGIPVVMPQDLRDNVIDPAGIARVPVEVAERLPRHWLEADDIVFSRRGDVTRRAWIRPEQAGWLCGTGCLRVRPDPTLVNARFLSFALGSDEVRTWLINHAVGATMPNLNTEILSNVPLTLPDLPTQTAIAEVLGSLDDKIAANERVAETALGLARATFASQSAGLARVPISEIALPLLGGTPDRARTDYWVGSVPWISVADVTSASCGYVLSTKESITEEAAIQTRARPVPKGTTIVSARGTVGAIGRTAMRASFNQSCYAFPPGELPPHVLFLTISEGMQEAVAHSHGSVFQTITMQTFEHLLAPDTRSIAETLEPRLSNIMERGDGALRENRALAATRDALLPALMSGELSVGDVAEVPGL